MYYKMYPTLYTENYHFNNKWEKDLLTNKYNSIQEAINFAKQTNICLREQNWYVYKCSWLFGCVRISLKSLYNDGCFSKEISKDNVSIYYNWK